MADPTPSQQPAASAGSDYPASSVAGTVRSSRGDVAELTFAPLDEAAAIRAVSDAGAGANVLFSGTTRDSFQGKQVTRLEYEAYTSLALKTLRGILEAAHTTAPFSVSSQPPSPSPPPASRITKVYVSHRLGIVPVGETSILIAVSSPHRKEAFVLAEWILEEVKKEVAIWKREVYADGRQIVAPDGQGPAAVWKANFPAS
ncbi:uncharacterized protein PFL1_00090 [Pseudozyma flocculosa PF-1]|uniref:Related to molybdopterin synthase large subunit n=1 Tax=Pseudozyma flocculosa TaxID=84751 RepID=A0A5C3ETN9_9BASI|nr:uncharacterized protein PFL1_00090 [Pseudozyma flocculosa PF-1]EPQ31891.1 hypothetical protein PFL1_00090 [Pseudozyma flocculosa PF-1]SPO35200.1 related to molybdopterin synthase large subunit [Pseudozyma flocculosa]